MRAPLAGAVLAVLVALLTGGTALDFEPEQTTRTGELTLVDRHATYPIQGRTLPEIGEALRTAGVLVDGRDYRGAYTWRLHWRFWHRQDGYGCRMTDVKVELAGVMALPRWSPAGAPEVARAWQRYEARLRAHENRHREIAIARAEALRAQMMRQRARDCPTLEAEANQLGQSVVDQITLESADFDSLTDHGRTQGVRWPPD